jgi:hypothetical protein
MNTFKRKSIHAAVLAGLGAMGMAGTASAVHVNPDGLGQVLIYPYYTVRSAATPIAAGQQNTYISVTNTTASAKAVKVRFIEGKNSREVLDFNLFLSPNDVWTGAVVPRSATAADGAKVISFDKSCTYGNVAAAGTTGVPFSNLQYTNGGAGNFADWETGSLDRTNEGYVEIMEMGVITDANLKLAVTHVAGVAPCTASVLTAADTAGLTGYLSAPTGGLFGGATLINTATGVDYAYDAVALDNWDNTATGKGSSSTSLSPSMSGGNNNTSDVFVGGVVQHSTWATPIDAVSAAIMRNNVMNEYVMDTSTASSTDWVVTFPTKRFYVLPEATAAASTAHTQAALVTPRVNPTARLFNSNFGVGGSCDVISITNRFDREEQFPTASSGGFSPVASGAVSSLCWEANVITFGHDGDTLPSASKVLGSTNHYMVSVPSSYANGWMSLGLANAVPGTTSPMLTPASSTTNGAPNTLNYYGLPVVGLMVQDFVNSTIVTGTGAAPGAAHGGNFVHKYTRDIH